MTNTAVMKSGNWTCNCQIPLSWTAIIAILKFQLLLSMTVVFAFLKLQLSISMTTTFDVFNIGIMSKLLLLFSTLKLI